MFESAVFRQPGIQRVQSGWHLLHTPERFRWQKAHDHKPEYRPRFPRRSQSQAGKSCPAEHQPRGCPDEMGLDHLREIQQVHRQVDRLSKVLMFLGFLHSSPQHGASWYQSHLLS